MPKTRLAPVWENYYLFDDHSHIGNYPDIRRSFGPNELLAYMKEYDIQCAAVSQLTRDMKKDNDDVMRLMHKAQGKVVGLGHVNPNSRDAVEEVERISRMGFKGVKMHPDIDSFNCFDLKFLAPVLDAIAKHKLPVLFHTGTPPHVTPVHIGFLAQHYREIPMICGHSGLADSTYECYAAARMAENVLFDTALASTPPVVENIVREFGADRVLWGSDVPYGNFISQFFWVYSLKLSERDKELIYGGNARRIFTL